MKNCALYSPNFDLNQVEEIIRALYPKDTIVANSDKTKITVTRRKWLRKTNYVFNMMTSHTHPKKFADMIEGMSRYFEQVETSHQSVQDKVLIQISTLNMVIGIETENEISDPFFEELLTMLRQLNGVVFRGNNELLDSEGRLLLDLDGNSEVKNFKVTAHTSFLHGNKQDTESSLRRRDRSEHILTEQAIPVNRKLPARPSEEAVSLRTVPETARRAIALCIAALKGECVGSGESMETANAMVLQVSNQFDAAAFFSPREQAFIDNEAPERDEGTAFSWGYEGFLVLLWALGYIEELEDPVSICDVPGVVTILMNAGSMSEFEANARLRSKSEILDAADLIYRYNWACVDSRLHNRAAPGGLDECVVYERHRALNWLIRYQEQDWDEVSTDT
ncbi:DUF4272 domain-containing protein [Paenibacillaceae bacterium]|nr:DUF4272 domain-containing protein [Paenibacillaceae bacterium]